jgi:hypothetical protein
MMNARRLSSFSRLLLTLAALPHLLHAQTTVTLSTSPNPSRLGAPVVLSAAVSPATATGRVTFYDGVTVVGTKPLVSGAASFSTSLLQAGNRKLRAYYGGDGSNAAATSNVVSQAVNAQPSASFAVGTPVATTATNLLAVADFNGDGKADFAASNGAILSILLGDGAGNFRLGFSFGAPSVVSLGAAGDFNGDGIVDLAYSTFPSSAVNILLGRGDGTFQAPATFPVPNMPFALVVADFNGDGQADIVAADVITGVDILLGKGDGTFQPAVSYLTNPTPPVQASAVLVADVNGDGKPDLIANNGTSSMSILLGNGDGTFQVPSIVALPSQGTSIAAGDFNGDGKIDLAHASVSGSVDILLGNGDGTFRTPLTYSTGSVLASLVTLGDFNGDGRTDLALSGGGKLIILLGNGDGTFQPPVSYAVVYGGQGVLVGEFNGDGRTDIAGIGGASVSLLLGTMVSVTPTAGTPQSTTITRPFPTQLQVTVKDSGNPVSGATVTFTPPSPTFAPSATLSSNTAITDANGVASVSATANTFVGNYVVTATALGISTQFALTNLAPVLANLTASPTQPQSALVGSQFPLPLKITATDPSGVPVAGTGVTFAVPTSGASAILSAGTVFADASGVASVTATANRTAGSYTVTATSGAFSATFSLTNLPTTSVPVTLTTSANPSNFGAPLILTASVSNSGANGKVTFFDGMAILGTKTASSGGASMSTVLLSAGAHRLTAYYRDDTNLLTGTSNVVTQTVKAAVGGAFITQNSLGVTPAGASVAIADFNNDGKPDIALPRFVAGFGAAVTVLLGKGDGSFQGPVDYLVGTNAASFIATGDFNGDGNTDIAVTTTSSGSGYVSVLLGNGDGTFRPAVNYAAASGFAVAVADFNGDGKADIAVAYRGTLFLPITAGEQVTPFEGSGFPFTSVYIFPGNGDGTFGSLQGYPTFNQTTVANFLVADFNGDGAPDIVFANPFIVLGNGVGGAQFPVAPVTGVTGTVTSMVSGDFNGDGKADIAFGGVASGTGAATTWILLGKGDGTFQPTMSYSGAAVTSGDFNGDGVIDLVVADVSGNTVGILQGRGDGTFQPGPAFSAGPSLAVSDFNGDGKADLLVNAANGGLTVLLGATSTGNGSGPPASIAASGGTPQSALVNSAFPSALQVTVRDAAGVPVGGASVTFAAPAAGASATLSTITALTSASGVASVTASANNLPGTYTVTASVAGLSTSFSLTNVLGASANLAFGKAATQSSTLPGYPGAGAASAVDGNLDGTFFNGSVTATNLDSNAWWQVDLGTSTAIGSVVIWNRTDCCGTRLNDFWVFISNTPFLPTDTPATLQNRAGTFSSHQTVAPNPSTLVAANGAQGRYVRIQLTGANYLSLAEVQVFAGTNLARGKPATQTSSYYPGSGAALAVDGFTDGNFFDGSVALTAGGSPNDWWQVDLGASAAISSIVIWNRTDPCCVSQLSDYWVFVSDTPFLAVETPATLQNRPGTFSSHQTTAPNPSVVIPVGAQGRYVRVQLTGQTNLSLAEVQVFGTVTSTGTNLAQGRVATQSSTLAGYPTAGANTAVDGNPDGNFFNGSVTATNADLNAWWQVDLGASAGVSSVVIFNRTDCCGTRLSDYWVFVSDTPFLPTDTPATLQGRAGTFGSHQTSTPNPSTIVSVGAQGRYVRVQLTGSNYLSLAEVQVFGTGGAPPPTDLAQGQSATQSSTLPGYASTAAAAAVDGNTDGNFFHGSVTATNLDQNAWWQVDLGASTAVGSIVVWNRTDCCGTRLSDYWVFVSDTPFLATDTPATLQARPGTFSSRQTTAPNPSTTVPIGAPGRYVRVQLTGANYLSLAEVQVFGQ